jgi:hypothetical protein
MPKASEAAPEEMSGSERPGVCARDGDQIRRCPRPRFSEDAQRLCAGARRRGVLRAGRRADRVHPSESEGRQGLRDGSGGAA